MEVSRNHGLKGLQRSDFANAAKAKFPQRIPVQTGAAPDLSVAEAAGFHVCQGSGDMIVDCAHAANRAHSVGLRKPKAQPIGLAKRPIAHYEVHMPFDTKAAQQAIERVAKRKGISLTAWALKAKLGRNTLTTFIRKPNADIKLGTICVLADVVGEHPYELMGITPPGALALEAAAMETIEQNLRRISSMYAGAAPDAQTALSLMRAAVRIRTTDTPALVLVPPSETPAQPKRPK